MVFIQVRDVGKIDTQAALPQLGDISPYRRFHLAEISRKSELLFVVDVLTAEDQYRITVHSGLYGRDCLRAQRVPKIYTGDLTGKARAQLRN